LRELIISGSTVFEQFLKGSVNRQPGHKRTLHGKERLPDTPGVT
jgi:hypothetical protein